MQRFLENSEGELGTRESRTERILHRALLAHDDPREALAAAGRELVAGRTTYSGYDYGVLARRYFERSAHLHPNPGIGCFVEHTLADRVLSENASFVALIQSGLTHTEPGAAGFLNFVREVHRGCHSWDRTSLGLKALEQLAEFPQTGAWGRACLALVESAPGSARAQLVGQLLQADPPEQEGEIAEALARLAPDLELAPATLPKPEQNDDLEARIGRLRTMAQDPSSSAWASSWEAAVAGASGSDEAQSALVEAAFARKPLREGLSQVSEPEHRYQATLGALLVLHHRAEGEGRSILEDTLTRMTRPGLGLEERCGLALAALDVLARQAVEDPLAPDIEFGEDFIDIGAISLPRQD